MHWNILAFSLILPLLLLGACTPDKPGASTDQKQRVDESAAAQSEGVAAGHFSLALSPRQPNRQAILELHAGGFDLGAANVQWLLNGRPVSTESAAQFICSRGQKGSTVQAIAVIRNREVRSNEVTISNTPPELSNVALQPALIGQEETLAVSASASDEDGDAVAVEYAWTVNGVLAGNGPALTCPLKRGDNVRVEVAAHDGTAYSQRVVLNRTIANHAPLFVEHQNFSFSGNTYVYQAQATDADGDRITYSLAEVVDGVSVDPATGRVTWAVPGGFRGEQSVTIVADDGHGGVARYPVTFTIKE